MANAHIIAFCLAQYDRAVGDDHPARAERWTDRLCKELYLLSADEFRQYSRKG